MPDNNHALLARIDERVGNIDRRMSELVEDIKTQDRRIRALEKWKWRMSGAITLLAVGSGVLGGKVLF